MAHTISFTRTQLYDMVWEMPITTIASKYNISATDFRIACSKLNVPIPKVGHWQRLKHNKQVEVFELDSNYKGQSEVVFELLSERKSTKEKVAQISKEIKVEDLDGFKKSNDILPDKLVVAAQKYLTSKDRYFNNGLVICNEDILDISVSRENLPRAFNFFDLLIKVLNKRGHSIKIQNRKTYVVLSGEDFQIAVREKLKRSLREEHSNWNSYDYSPTGLLVFKLDGFHKREWTDGKQKIESLIPNIIVKLEEVTIQTKELHEQTRIWREEFERKRQIEREEDEKIERELVLFKELLVKARRHRDSCLIREYISAIENSNNSEVQEWLQWAKSKADWYDPSVEKTDEILATVDKGTLTFKKKGLYY